MMVLFAPGKTLVLDGKSQSAKADEAVYHESLIHPAMLLHGAPKRVFIGGGRARPRLSRRSVRALNARRGRGTYILKRGRGPLSFSHTKLFCDFVFSETGGELASARETLRHRCVEEVVMVDLDEEVVEACKKYMPEWHGGCIDDPRLKVHYGDARAWLISPESGLFDVIVLDISDPIEAGPAVHLYTLEFYTLIRAKLNPGGLIVTQSGPGGMFNYGECFTAINKTLNAAFDHVAPYVVSIPSFGSDWAFNIAYSADSDRPTTEQFRLRNSEVIDAQIARQITGEQKHYDGQSHALMFSLLKCVRNGLAEETRVITEANPVFMY